MSELTISVCPTCGSPKIRLVKRDIEKKMRGTPFIARDIEIEECPNCGERLFSPEALRKIESQRPKVRGTGNRRRTA